MNRQIEKIEARRMSRGWARTVFRLYCKIMGWRYHVTSMHDTKLNAFKLHEGERASPSFLVDPNFDDKKAEICWVEVKSANAHGDVRIPVQEYKIHQVLDEMREVYYALYDQYNDDSIKLVPLHEVISYDIDERQLDDIPADDYIIINSREVEADEITLKEYISE